MTTTTTEFFYAASTAFSGVCGFPTEEARTQWLAENSSGFPLERQQVDPEIREEFEG